MFGIPPLQLADLSGSSICQIKITVKSHNNSFSEAERISKIEDQFLEISVRHREKKERLEKLKAVFLL